MSETPGQEEYEQAIKEENAGNHVEAFRLFNVAASLDHLMAEYRLGLCHVHGCGTPVNRDLGISLLRSAASRGCVEAENALRDVEGLEAHPCVCRPIGRPGGVRVR